MIVVAGPPGSGKSSAFPVSAFGVAFFNADDRAAELNGGSYHGISRKIRQTVNRELETFIESQIDSGRSFAIETTLRSTVTFEQSRRARAAGFVIEMRYLALRDFALHLERIKARADAGGHAASETTLRQIYHSSLANLAQAVAEADQIWVYDNGKTGGPPLLVLEAEAGIIHFLAEQLPPWLVEALHF
ncbi:MAG: zeta toxin family protein [Bryobacteraceae bacterium]